MFGGTGSEREVGGGGQVGQGGLVGHKFVSASAEAVMAGFAASLLSESDPFLHAAKNKITKMDKNLIFFIVFVF